MCLVHHTQHAVGTSGAEGNEAAILDDEDAIVRVRDDSGLVLRDLNDDKTEERDDGIGNYASLSMKDSLMCYCYSLPRVPHHERAHQLRSG